MADPFPIPPYSEQFLAGKSTDTRLAVIMDLLLGTSGGNVAPTIPNTVPATIAAGVTYDSGVITVGGYNNFAASAQLTQTGTLTLQRYIDAAGTVAIGDAVTQAMTANTLATVAVADGLPCASFNVTVQNTSGSLGALSKFNVLEKK